MSLNPVVLGNSTLIGRPPAPNFFKSGNQYNEDTPQAHVGVNSATVFNFLKTRQANNVLPADRRLGSVSNNNQLHILTGEPVYMATSQGHQPSMFPGDSRPRALTSFNGEVIRKGASQQDFNSRFKLLGFAITDFAFGEPSQTQSGFTTRVGGSGTTLNNGSKRFLPGDAISARIPSIDRAQRKADDRARPTVHGVPADKQTAILEPLSFREYHNAYMRQPVEWYMTEASAAEADFNRLNLLPSTGMYSKLDLRQETALMLDRFITQVVLAGVSVLEASGLIMYTDPTGDGGSGAWRSNPAFYSSLPEKVLERFTAKMLAERTVRMEGGEPLIEEYDARRLQEIKRERTNRLGYIAALLGGLPPNPNAPHIKPSQELKQAVFGRSMWPLLPSQEEMESLSIRHYLVGSSLKRRRNNISNVAGLEQTTAALLRLQTEGSKELTKSMSVAKASLEGNIIGIARNTAAPGEELDYYI